jgi:hypothetical protein
MPLRRGEVADDTCPVSDEFLGELCRANGHFIPSFVSAMAPDIKALLALFCYRRSHLHSMGLAIAATCDIEHLVWAGQGVGKVLFASSREVSSAIVSDIQKGKVTLARGIIRKFDIIDEPVVEATLA